MNSMPIIGRAQPARTSELNGNFVCMFTRMFVPNDAAHAHQTASVINPRACAGGLL